MNSIKLTTHACKVWILHVQIYMILVKIEYITIFVSNMTIVFYQWLTIMRDYVVVVIHHYTQWLTHNDGSPDHHVSPAWSPTFFHVSWQLWKRYLAHHTHKRPYLKCLQWNAYLYKCVKCQSCFYNGFVVISFLS